MPIRELLAFPFQRINLETPLPVGDVLKRMQDTVEPRKLWRFSRSHRDFEGIVTLNRFKIVRVIHYRNSFLPVIEGTIQPRVQGGSTVGITMRMHWLVTAFMILWFSVPVAIVGAVLLHLHPGGSSAYQTGAALFGVAILLLCFGYCLCSVCFNIEARRARDLLMRIVSRSDN